ncbi:MAG: MBL fold metallo-hydrolase [Euryarchaeota archaeon]|jgi:phosphoribosyl 1,2-cyclic phosphodiesterase|nr:MBL fold metallo-hydrolase [Euryarchaeota archaeon]MBT4392233.1 MBL fold metallo-hydrolase [Euryarchaeota archaeon]MBT4803269.1 MBL fold metallo-hydrolase [Euryarchaeota archaeon]MBT5614354.1 MBL fold metallo-hydrolase [Euryarchaeota archaeon]MBT6683549.1 MBL fold metallo-hydrolase [Euryarchaeota archaeon]
MSLEIIHLGSGSRGNSTLLRTDETNVLIDCGFSLKQIEKKLIQIGLEGKEIDSIIVTHHHGDHSKSAKRASIKWDSVLHSNIETSIKMGWEPMEVCKTFNNLDRVECGVDFSFISVPIPHDNADNVAIITNSGKNEKAAFITDLGESTLELEKYIQGCKHISIEANYDQKKLMNSAYPDSLKRRISGRGGHLSNYQTGEILSKVCHSELSSIVLCHLSEKNNAPHLAESEVLYHIGEIFDGSLSISKQMGPEFSNFI